jgi:putative transcriptional regulator
MSKVGKGILKGAREALAIARGKAEPAAVYGDVDVARIRQSLGLTQKELAKLIAVSVRTVQEWEQHRKAPNGPARSLLKVAEKEPKAVRRALVDTIA